jgi:hypothetical protein
VLISARRLVDHVRHGSERAHELAAVRHRLVATRDREHATEDERALADQLRHLREALAASFSAVTSCTGCAKGHPLPHGLWDGGHCCGTRTELVFTDDELAALRIAGTEPSQLLPPAGARTMGGCAFRGADGCSLSAANRPSICVRYICRELEEELRRTGQLATIRVIAADLAKASERWRRLRAAATPDLEPWDDR